MLDVRNIPDGALIHIDLDKYSTNGPKIPIVLTEQEVEDFTRFVSNKHPEILKMLGWRRDP